MKHIITDLEREEVLSYIRSRAYSSAKNTLRQLPALDLKELEIKIKKEFKRHINDEEKYKEFCSSMSKLIEEELN